MSHRARWAMLVAGIALFVAGASTVFVIGSNNRRSDRDAVLRYEAQVLAQVREMNVLGGSMLNAVDAFRAGRLDAGALATQTRGWSDRFDDVARRIAAVPVPIAIGRAEPMFTPAARAWATASSLYASFATCTPRGGAACVAGGADGDAAVAQALQHYERARTALQQARKRLDLGRSPNFGDPPR